jgi:hypothetical protein
MQKRDLLARVIGLLVFALGIAILVVSFVIAYRLFTSPSAGLVVAPSKPGAVVTNLSNSALTTVRQIGLLVIMVLVGSLVASRGIQMYFAGERIAKSVE